MAPATKRVATKAPTSPVRASKVAKKDYFGDACVSALLVLEQDGSLTDAARSMLAAAAPFALKSSKEDRHSYQAATVAALAEIYSRVDSEKKEAVKVLEVKAAECSAGKSSLESNLSKAKEAEGGKLGAQLDAKKAMDEAQAEVPKAKKAVADAKTAEDNLEKQHEQNKTAQAERELLLSDTWTRLKEMNFPGKEWQLRKKKTEVIVGVLDGLDCETSLKLALPIALKSKPEERGVFGKKSVECVDSILQKSLQDIVAKVAAHESNVSEAKAAVAAAEEVLAKAKAAQDEKATAFVAAENEHCEAVNASSTEKDSLKKLVASEKSLVAELDSAKEDLSSLVSLGAQFAALAEGGAAATEPKAPEPEAVEEPAKKDEEMPAAEGADAPAVEA